jgi:hypothetical protein
MPKAADVARYNISVQLKKANDLVELLKYFEVGTDVLTLCAPLTDVTIAATDTLTTGLIHITALAGYSNEDLVTYLPTVLALTANFVCKNAATGLSIAITSVTAVPGIPGTLAVQLNASDSHYPTTGNTLTLAMASPSTLATNGLTTSDGGFEGINTLILTV